VLEEIPIDLYQVGLYTIYSIENLLK